MSNKNLMTAEGLKKLEEQLHELKTTKRSEIKEKIKVALSFGDLSENAEYDEAKNEQAFVEGKISQLEETIKNAVVVKGDDLSGDTVNLGTVVTVYDVEFEEEEEYHIVGSAEADPEENKISIESPIGEGLLGKKTGDNVTIMTPGGEIEFEIKAIKKA